MSYLDLELDSLLRSLITCMEHKDVCTMLDLQRKATSLRSAIHEYSNDMEKRVTENVLKAISIKFQSEDALKELKPLKKAIDSLLK